MMGMMRRFAAQQGRLINGSGGGVVAGQYALVSDGSGAYIDTGILLTSTNDFEITTAVTDIGSTSFISGSSTSGSGVSIPWVVSTSNMRVWFNSGWTTLLPSTSWSLGDWIVGGKAGDTAYTENGDSADISSGFDDQLYSAFLFRWNVDGTAAGDSACKIQRHIVWSDSTRITQTLNMWPVPSGMTANGASTPAPSNCMWDAVSETYFENQGTGSFTIEALT